MRRRPTSRPRTVIAALAVTVLLGALTACGPQSEVNTTPKKQTGGQPASKAQAAKVGDTLALKGTEDGSKLDVTVKSVADPAQPADEYQEPGSGKRWVGAQFELVNTGSKAYDDAPSNGAQVVDNDGQRFEATIGDITAGPSMTTEAKIAPGGKALGWIVFEVPKDVKLSEVQFAMDSGFADQTGQWKITR
jgi:hypothetical protein